MIIWTDYLKYRAALRGFNLAVLEDVIRYSGERYIDNATGRYIAVGRYHQVLIMIPYESDGTNITPVTVHTITRQQITFRLRTGRFTYA